MHLNLPGALDLGTGPSVRNQMGFSNQRNVITCNWQFPTEYHDMLAQTTGDSVVSSPVLYWYGVHGTVAQGSDCCLRVCG